MATRKRIAKKKTKAGRKKAAAPKRRAKVAAKSTRRAAAKRARPGKPARPKARAKKRLVRRGSRRREQADLDLGAVLDTRGLGPEAGGQSGDTEGLSRAELADSESVEELIEEGQAFEAGVVEGVETAPDADRGPIRTKEVPEDDVPEEYLDRDR